MPTDCEDTMANGLILNDALKSFTFDQDKVRSPEDTVRLFKNKLQTVKLDILEETIRIDNGRLDIPVFFSVCGKDAVEVIGTKKQMGKGGTPEQAEASAVMELAERFSFFSYNKNPENFVQFPFSAVKENAMPFEMIAQSVHDESDELLLSRQIFEKLTLRWTWGFDITENRSVLIPFDWFFMINEFNGPSAGNCNEEALSQGICEVVERHVCSLVSRGRLQVPRIDLSSAKDALVNEMIQKYSSAGIELFATDFTLDTGIPTVGVLAWDPQTFPDKSEIVWTAGTTPNPEKAFSRALTEVAQLAGDFNTGANYVASGLPKLKALSEAEHITNPSSTKTIDQLPDLSHNNIKNEVMNLVSALADQKMNVITVDIKNSLLEIPAYYTIIPGAHFRERAVNTSIGMFSAKMISETYPVHQAVQMLNEADKLLPDKYYIQFYKGTCHLNTGDILAALDCFEQALDLDPVHQDLASIYAYMGVCLKELNNFRDALKVLKTGIDIDPERTDIYNLMGFCHFKLKEHEKAIECFEKLLKLNPSSAIDYANIASNYREMGKISKAVEYYDMALALDPTIDFARENLMKLTSGSRL
jgi:ribosomal protein S12 methylthiotransferase accessory factor